MLAIERTTKRFVASLTRELPTFQINVERSRNDYGRSNYVHIYSADRKRYWKVRISDHKVGMRRAQSGQEDLYLWAGAIPQDWSVWLGDFIREATALETH